MNPLRSTPDLDSRRGNLLRGATSCLETIARRDLNGLPVYMVPASQCPEAAQAVPSWAIAMTAPYTGRLAERYLRVAGLWRGVGIGLILQDRFPGFTWTPPAILGHGIHELGHAVLTAAACVDVLTPEVVFDSVPPATGDAVPVAEPTEQLWAHHGPAWIRTVIHLCHRAKWLGHPVELSNCCVAGRVYSLSPAARYACALGDEPRSREGETLTAVVYSPYPRAFEELWTADTNEPV